MHIEEIIPDVRKKQEEIMRVTFENPPADFAKFREAVGFYNGLQAVLNCVVEEQNRRREKDDE